MAKDTDTVDSDFRMPLRLNWKMVRAQKRALVEALNREAPRKHHPLDGLLHLLDAIQDYAVEHKIADEKQVFGKNFGKR